MAHLSKENCLTVLSEAGPVLRYRTDTEILYEHRQVDVLLRRVLDSEYVRQWLGSLNPRYDRNMHGSTSDAYENVMGKIYDFGLRKGIKELDCRVQPFLEILSGETRFEDEQYMGKLYDSMIAGFLAMTGYSYDENVNRVLTERLDRIFNYVRLGDLSDFHISREGFKGVPKAFQGKKLVNPEYYDERGLALPTVYDMFGFLHSEPIMKDPVERSKVEKTIELVLSEEYQALPFGYGYVWKPPGKYYAMGWSIHLPLYNGAWMSGGEFSRLLLFLELFKRSKAAMGHPWFGKSLDYLGQFIGDARAR